MKKILLVVMFLAVASFAVPFAFAAKPTEVDSNGVETSWNSTGCTTIQDGVLTYSAGHYLAGEILQVGFDDYGYNYQAHMFKGSYANAYLGGMGYPPYTGDDATYLADNPGAVGTWVWPYRAWNLQMKWDDMWLANTDCNTDGKLDRHYGHTSYIGSGAWTTNHMSLDGYNYFAKFVAAPVDANLVSGYWYTSDGVEIGPVIWSDFAVVQEVESGSGALYVSPNGPGFGQY